MVLKLLKVINLVLIVSARVIELQITKEISDQSGRFFNLNFSCTFGGRTFKVLRFDASVAVDLLTRLTLLEVANYSDILTLTALNGVKSAFKMRSLRFFIIDFFYVNIPFGQGDATFGDPPRIGRHIFPQLVHQVFCEVNFVH